MRRVAVGLILSASLAAPASAAELMVVGRTGTLVAPRTASPEGAKVRVEGHRCRLAARTPLAALAHAPVRLTLRDYGACGSRPADAAAVYVRAIDGQRERGRGGWVYKLGDAAPSLGAADPSGRFAKRARVLWFWCVSGPGGCQRTLSVAPDRSAAAPGETLRVTVRAHDDQGRAVPARGATVTMGSARATAGPDGVAELTVPPASGTLGVVATQAKRVRSFPARVRVQ
jgi:hypothetical protein